MQPVIWGSFIRWKDCVNAYLIANVLIYAVVRAGKLVLLLV